MKKLTVSISKGKANETSIRHNNRKQLLATASSKKQQSFYAQKGHQHIQAKYTHLNEDYIRDPKKIYDEVFGEAIKEYNTKQTRNDRKIGKGNLYVRTGKDKALALNLYKIAISFNNQDKSQQDRVLRILSASQDNDTKNFLEQTRTRSIQELDQEYKKLKKAKTLGECLYDKQKRGKQSKTHTELIFQIGNAADFNKLNSTGEIVDTLDREDPEGIWQKSKTVLKKFEKDFEKQNPNLVVSNWSIHMDETTPHMHIQVIPVADVSKTTPRGKKRRNGLKLKPSFDGALECEGFKKDPHDSRKAFKDWQHAQADTLSKVMEEELGAHRQKGLTNRIKDIHEYKELKKQEISLRKQISSHEKQEKAFRDRERDLTAREYGGTTSSGKHVEGVIDRERAISQREATVTIKEKALRNYDSKISLKKRVLADYNQNLEDKKKKLLEKKNAELKKKNAELKNLYTQEEKKLQQAYKTKKITYTQELTALRLERDKIKNTNTTSSKFIAYASYIYHSCAETFIKALDPSTQDKYVNFGHRTSENSAAHDMARGHYYNLFDEEYTGKNSLDILLLKAKSNKKLLWNAIKKTGKKLLSLLNTKETKELIKKIDNFDETGLTDALVAQATNEDQLKERERQAKIAQINKEKQEKLKRAVLKVNKKDKDDETDLNF